MEGNRYYLDWDDIELCWLIMEIDAGHEHGAYYDVMVCAEECKQSALFIRDALEAFPKTLSDYL